MQVGEGEKTGERFRRPHTYMTHDYLEKSPLHTNTVFPAEPSSRLQVGWGENESVGKGQPTRRNGVIPVPNFGGSNFLCSCSAKIRPKLVQARLGATATGG